MGNTTSYTIGGRENVDWIYTNDENDTRCLTNWTYLDAQGSQLLIYFYSLLFNLIKIDFLLILIHYHEWTLGVS